MPHTYYEEDNLHGFLLEKEKDYSRLVDKLDIFLPYVDNWATCDMIRPKWVAQIRSEEYYVNMMIAWYFATALAKQYDASIRYIEEHKLDEWTHNKAIQKAMESYRVTDEQKSYLRTLKIK